MANWTLILFEISFAVIRNQGATRIVNGKNLHKFIISKVIPTLLAYGKNLVCANCKAPIMSHNLGKLVYNEKEGLKAVCKECLDDEILHVVNLLKGESEVLIKQDAKI